MSDIWCDISFNIYHLTDICHDTVTVSYNESIFLDLKYEVLSRYIKPAAVPEIWGDVVFIRLYQFFVVGNVVTGNIVEIDFPI